MDNTEKPSSSKRGVSEETVEGENHQPLATTTILRDITPSMVELPWWTAEEEQRDCDIYNLSEAMVQTLSILEGFGDFDIQAQDSSLLRDLTKIVHDIRMTKMRDDHDVIEDGVIQLQELKCQLGTKIDIIMKSVQGELRGNEGPKVGYSSTSLVPEKLKTVMERDSVFEIITYHSYETNRHRNPPSATCDDCSIVFQIQPSPGIDTACGCSEPSTSTTTASNNSLADSVKFFQFLLEKELLLRNTDPERSIVIIGAADGNYAFGAKIFGGIAHVVACENDKMYNSWLNREVHRYKETFEGIQVLDCLVPDQDILRKASAIFVTERAQAALLESEWETIIGSAKAGTIIISQGTVESAINNIPSLKKEWDDKMELVAHVLKLDSASMCENCSCSSNACRLVYRVKSEEVGSI